MEKIIVIESPGAGKSSFSKKLKILLNYHDITQICYIIKKDEWADNKEENRKCRIERKKEKIYNAFNDEFFCKLILVDNNKLIGFISIFPKDCEEEKELKPWYATMYVKKEYRKKGYSRILNDAILKEAKNRGFTTIYLKTDLKNYYEKFGAIFIKKLKTGETLYKIELQ